jgi:hypothetical protein
LCPLSLRDAPSDGECQLLLIDWVSLDADGREEYLADLLPHPGDRRVGLHSYYSSDDEVDSLRHIFAPIWSAP